MTDDTTIKNGGETTFLQGSSGLSMFVFALPSDGSGPSAYADAFADSIEDQSGSETEPYIDQSTGETTDLSNQLEAIELLGFAFEDGNDGVLDIHAQVSPNGRYVVMIAAIAPERSFNLVEEQAMPLMEQVEFYGRVARSLSGGTLG